MMEEYLSKPTRRRFHADHAAFSATEAGGVVTLGPEETRHLRDVLRLRPGDEAYVFDGEGREYLCTVAESVGRRDAAATLEVRERVEPASPESNLQLTLAVALLKGDKFDLVVQKATELGVSRILPVITHRADLRLRDERDAARRTERWQRLALEAAKQSGRARVPEVFAPLSLPSVINASRASFADTNAPALAESSAGLRLMFAEREGRGLAETFADSGGVGETLPRSIITLTGPEGGWETEEVMVAARAGWSVVTLGGRTLRAETAAITVAALLQHLFGDLK